MEPSTNLWFPPEAIGKACFPDWWTDIVQRKKQHDREEESASIFTPRNHPNLFSNKNDLLGGFLNRTREESWKDFIGSE
jgi:hypothetical protein